MDDPPSLLKWVATIARHFVKTLGKVVMMCFELIMMVTYYEVGVDGMDGNVKVGVLDV